MPSSLLTTCVYRCSFGRTVSQAIDSPVFYSKTPAPAFYGDPIHAQSNLVNSVKRGSRLENPALGMYELQTKNSLILQSSTSYQDILSAVGKDASHSAAFVLSMATASWSEGGHRLLEPITEAQQSRWVNIEASTDLLLEDQHFIDLLEIAGYDSVYLINEPGGEYRVFSDRSISPYFSSPDSKVPDEVRVIANHYVHTNAGKLNSVSEGSFRGPLLEIARQLKEKGFNADVIRSDDDQAGGCLGVVLGQHVMTIERQSEDGPYRPNFQLASKWLPELANKVALGIESFDSPTQTQQRAAESTCER